MQESTSRIFGIPGVALLDKTNAPALRKTVFLNPDSFIHSLISIINGEAIPVTSDILSQRKPFGDRYSCIGRGEPPRLISTKSPNIPEIQSSGVLPPKGT